MKVRSWKKIAIMPENWARGYADGLVDYNIEFCFTNESGEYYEDLNAIWVTQERWEGAKEHLEEYCEEHRLKYFNILQA